MTDQTNAHKICRETKHRAVRSSYAVMYMSMTGHEREGLDMNGKMTDLTMSPRAHHAQSLALLLPVACQCWV